MFQEVVGVGSWDRVGNQRDGFVTSGKSRCLWGGDASPILPQGRGELMFLAEEQHLAHQAS